MGGRDLYIVIICLSTTAVSPSDFEAFYTSFKSYEDSLNAELPAESLKLEVMQFKHHEVFLESFIL